MHQRQALGGTLWSKVAALLVAVTCSSTTLVLAQQVEDTTLFGALKGALTGCEVEHETVGQAVSPQPRDTLTAIVGASIIDGTGAPPLQGGTVLIVGRRIAAVGPRPLVPVSPGAHVIDGSKLFVLPGFVDANVHISAYGQVGGIVDTTTECLLVRAQYALQHGVTTLRDTYGVLKPLKAVRDSINAGFAAGPRLLVAGNIVGWSERSEPAVTQGVGQELVGLAADSLRKLINMYLDKGVDFVKYGATTHRNDIAAVTLFGEHAQRIIVEETHKRGLIVDTHATSEEGMRFALLAGVDVIQHPEAMALDAPLSDELIKLIVDRKAICSMNTAQAIGQGTTRMLGIPAMPIPASTETRRRNAQALIKAGCTVAVASDFMGGETTLQAIEALVPLGMTSMDAIVAATANGAKACKKFDQFGTVTTGKVADLVVLRADPLLDIHNIRQIAMVFKDGRQVH